jgi:hypothetical protein
VCNGIPGTPVNNDAATVHRVAGCVICIAIDDYRGAAHKHTKVTPGDAVYGNGDTIPPKSISDEPLTEHIIDHDLGYPFSNRFPDHLVEWRVMDLPCIDA